MTTRFIDHLLEGDHAERPAFGAVPQGTLYACSDHGLIYQSDGVSAWSTWATLGGGTPAAHATSHQNGGGDEISVAGLSGALADAQPVAVHKNGTIVGTRKNINLIEGTNVTLTVADDAGDDEVDVTIAASGGGGGGGLVLLEQHTASASASLDFTSCISATYDEYLIEIIGIVPATNGAVLYWRASTDGGSTYDATGVYDYSELHTQFGGSEAQVGAAGATEYRIFSDGAGAALLNTATPALVASLRLFDPGSTSNHKVLLAKGFAIYSALGARYFFDGAGVYKSTTAVDAFRFIMSSGNITSGTIRVYGLAK